MSLINKVIVPFAILFLLYPTAQLVGDSHRTRDHWIEERVRREFAADERMADVRVEVDRQLVHLSGSVAFFEHKREAAKLAMQVPRVNGVLNLIKVDTERVPDPALHAIVGQRLNGDGLEDLRIKARNSYIAVTGDVRTAKEREKALRIIGNTPGVRGISDQIRILNSTE